MASQWNNYFRRLNCRPLLKNELSNKLFLIRGRIFFAQYQSSTWTNLPAFFLLANFSITRGVLLLSKKKQDSKYGDLFGIFYFIQTILPRFCVWPLAHLLNSRCNILLYRYLRGPVVFEYCWADVDFLYAPAATIQSCCFLQRYTTTIKFGEWLTTCPAWQ